MVFLYKCLRKVARTVVDLSIILIIFTVMPGIPPHITFTSFSPTPTRPLDGPLTRNTLLNDAKRILPGKIRGPESIASRKPDEIFVSLHGGKILQIYGEQFDHFKIVASIGPGCAGPWQEKICGRPLGLRFDSSGKLLVADSYLGIFSVDVQTGEKERLFDPSLPIDGSVPLFIDDLDIDSDGNIYWSDASTVFDLSQCFLAMMCDANGRLIKFDPKTRTNTVLINKLNFANGVQLSPKHDFVLVSESVLSQVRRYWLKGARAGQSEMFVDGLPGMPDNIRARPEGGFYVSLVMPKDPAKSDTLKTFASWPMLRKLVARLFRVTQMLFDTMTTLVPNTVTERLSYEILNHDLIMSNVRGGSNMTIIVELDENGIIIGSLMGDNGAVRFVSETQKVGNRMFFGSPWNDYLGYLELSEMGSGPGMDVDGEGVRVVNGKEEGAAGKIKENSQKVEKEEL